MTSKIMTRERRLAALACLMFVAPGLGLGCKGCTQFPKAPKSDAGLAAWARQVVPVLYGRKAKGREEVKVIVDLANAAGRSAAVDALMAQPEFVEHWAEVFVDRLPIDRKGQLGQGTCFGAPQPATPSAALATHIITQPATTPFAGTHNMSDVLRSAIVADNLGAFFRAHMFAHTNLVPPGMSSAERRENLGAAFTEMFIGREMLCLQCHNSDQSTTDASSNWNRAWPIPASFELAVFGAATGTDPKHAYALFRGDQRGGGSAPWGLSGCGTFKTGTLSPLSGVSPYYTGSLPAGATIRHLEARFKSGYDGLADNGLDRNHPPALEAACNDCQACAQNPSAPDPASATNANFVKGILQSTTGPRCAQCHQGSANPSFDQTQWWSDLVNVASPAYGDFRVKPGDPDNSVLIKKITGVSAGQRMPPGGPFLSTADINKFRAWVTDLGANNCPSCSDLGCNVAKRNVEGDEAFAYLVAARAVEVIWEEAMGYPVTIANYFPRNRAQRGIQWHLTERVFLPNDWSLKRTLRFILTSDFFARKAPDRPGVTEPYDLPMVYDAFVEADPRKPPVSDPGYDATQHPQDHKNAMTDGIYRYRAWSLRNSIHNTLDWPGQDRFPPASDQLAPAIGQYISVSDPGFQSTTFTALLEWESVHGLCTKPNGVGQDWVDRAIAAARAHDQANPASPLILRDMIELERDWFLSHGGLGAAPTPSTGFTAKSEAQAILDTVGSPLTTALPDLSDSELQTKLRAYCGVLVKTPHYLLHGVTFDDLGPVPKLRVCNSAPCTYQEICNDLASDVPGQTVTCGVDTLAAAKIAKLLSKRSKTLCPAGVCGYDDRPFDARCLQSRRGCKAAIPLCDPRCVGLGCCAPPPDFKQRGTFVAFAEGSAVQTSDKVRILRKDTTRFVTLKPGDTLQEGDLLEIPADAELSIPVGAKKLVSTPGLGTQTEYMVVTGPKATARLTDAPAPKWRMSPEMMEDLTSRTFRRFGEAGPPRALPRRYEMTRAEVAQQERLRAAEAE